MEPIDNINHRLGEDLKKTIRKDAQLSIAASSFPFKNAKKDLMKKFIPTLNRNARGYRTKKNVKYGARIVINHISNSQ